MTNEEIYIFLQNRISFDTYSRLEEFFEYVTDVGSTKEYILNRMIIYYEREIKFNKTVLKNTEKYINSKDFSILKMNTHRNIRMYSDVIRSLRDELMDVEMKKQWISLDNHLSK